jgi:hypothetical protein
MYRSEQGFQGFARAEITLTRQGGKSFEMGVKKIEQMHKGKF